MNHQQADITKVSLFSTCIIDQLYPEVGTSVVNVLRQYGCEVDFPLNQTCCGQPLYNSGFAKESKKLALKVLNDFAHSNYVIVPSGSCAAMMRNFYLDLFDNDQKNHPRAVSFAKKVYEFSEFLVRVLNIQGSEAKYTGKGTYHPSCHLLREIGEREAPEILLRNVVGLELVDLPQAEYCCGFGGSFSIKYPHISEAMGTDKLENVISTGADSLISCDMGCLMQVGGLLSRNGSKIQIRHLSQILDQEIHSAGS
tara:strand:- start:126 stop:887 length:762 start_codon:yes stop_codon:yes gene_type:complete